MKKVLKIAELVSPIISSRDVSRVLKSEIEKVHFQQIDLDFTNVEFISRSAAHQMIEMKEELANRDSSKDITFTNTSISVETMLRVVAANRVLPKPSFRKVNPPKVISFEEFARVS